ncbi:MAG TPA: alpha-L-rhamnosidase, partial [Acidimicrobiia bacterium]|nr:alpha-L-rhamnosidase [Acidimicrobiia bacterium]
MRGGMRRAGVLVVVGLVLAFAAAPAPASAAGSNHAPGPPSSLTVDEDAMPLWVTDDPLFGWQVNDADRGEVQSAYEIVVYDGAPADASHLLADTGRVSTDRQTFVDVAGLAAKLAPDHSYWWTVRTWDRAGAVGPYAPLARFDTALRDADWHADWIRRAGAENAQYEDYSLVRTQVRISASPVVRARVYASAGHHYDLRVNGVRRAHGPSYAYPDEQYYETT